MVRGDPNGARDELVALIVDALGAITGDGPEH
jgi:hypothetical protein